MAKKKKADAVNPVSLKPKNPCPVCGRELYSDTGLIVVDKGKVRTALKRAIRKYGKAATRGVTRGQTGT